MELHSFQPRAQLRWIRLGVVISSRAPSLHEQLCNCKERSSTESPATSAAFLGSTVAAVFGKRERHRPHASGGTGNEPSFLFVHRHSSAGYSSRLRVLPGDNDRFAGFIVTGTEDKRVIVRGLGHRSRPRGSSRSTTFHTERLL